MGAHDTRCWFSLPLCGLITSRPSFYGHPTYNSAFHHQIYLIFIRSLITTANSPVREHVVCLLLVVPWRCELHEVTWHDFYPQAQCRGRNRCSVSLCYLQFNEASWIKEKYLQGSFHFLVCISYKNIMSLFHVWRTPQPVSSALIF